MDDAKPSILPHFDDQSGEIIVRDSTAQLAVQRIHSGLARRISVYLAHCPAKLLCIEECALDPLGVILKPFIGAEARTRGSSQLAPDLILLLSYALSGFSYKIVMGFVPGKRRCI